MPKKSFSLAIYEALKQEMERDKTVIAMGEDVGRFGGCYGVTRDLWKIFGEERVRDTPITESAFIGAAAGAAMAGMRPVVELMFCDFFGVTMDQIYNQAAKIRFMSGGQTTVPLVLRTTIGAGFRAASQHSQSLYATFAHLPGMKVIVPSTPYDAKGLLISAIRDDSFDVFMENKKCYAVEGEVPDKAYTVPIGKADVKREGKDVTVVALAWMVHEALDAAKDLEKEGISIEVVDPRTVYPLDVDAIVDSVKKTGRLVAIDEGYTFCGFAGEVISTVSEKAFDSLKSAPVRVATPHQPIPFSPVLEDYILPNKDKLIKAVKATVA